MIHANEIWFSKDNTNNSDKNKKSGKYFLLVVVFPIKSIGL